MKLVRLVVARLPGIAERLELLPAAGRVSVVVGPNASGKTSLIRALAALVQHSPDNRPVDIEAEFHDGEHRILGRAIGQARTWWRDGNEIARPDWPDADQLGAYLIRAEQLADAGATERQFSETLRQVMAGGYDLDALAGAAPFEKPARPRKLAGEYSDAGQRLQKLESGHAELAAEIDQIGRAHV
jgi:DNA repair protein SbcC/Rad50